jgi:DNA-binding CsgD family transcriptional regulator
MTRGEARTGVVIGELVPSLVRWGQSPDADLVYRSLVTLGPGTGRDLRRGLGIAAKRVSHAIDELVSIGAIVSRPGADPDATWSAKSPAEVVSALNRARLTPGARRGLPPRERQAATAAVLPEPLVLGEGLRHLVTRALTRERLVELNAAARHELLSMNPEEVFEPESVRAGAPLDRRLVNRAVPIRALGVQPSETVPLAPPGRSASGPKHRYRQALAVPMKLLVYDRRVALFPVDPHNFDRGYLEVTQPPVVSALVAMFERTWAGTRDPMEDAMPEVVLSSRERALICLLAQGHTDITAAHQLGVSPRSVSTMMRQLMDRFQVENRFQLGLALGALQAVPLPQGDAARHGEGQ